MRQFLDMLAAMFDKSETGCVFFEKNLPQGDIKVTFMNSAAQGLLNHPQHSMDQVADMIFSYNGSPFNGQLNDSPLHWEFFVPRKDMPVRVALVRDQTRQKKLDDSVLILKHMLNSVQDAVYAIDEEGNELFFNQNIKRFNADHRKEMLRELLSVFKTGKRVKDQYLNYVTEDHSQVHILSSYFPVKKKGNTIAVISVNKFITEIRTWLKKAIDLQSQVKACANIGRGLFNGTRFRFEDIIGQSPKIKAVIEKALKASSGYGPILIYGETGTGKEMFAQSIHNQSLRADEPFIAVVCAAIPDSLLESILFGTKKGAFTGAEETVGLFEQAKGGTLFLDEINSMSVPLQTKLLRVLQERQVRRVGGSKERRVYCQVISSTNENPWELVETQRLRNDLFYRLAGMVLTIPPLRERPEDILLLIEHFLKNLNDVYGKKIKTISPELNNLFLSHSWPGNVRELSHIIEGAVNLIEGGRVLTPKHLPDYFTAKAIDEDNITGIENRSTDSLPEKLKAIEKQIVLGALKKNGGNISRSAQSLKIHRQNLQARMKRLGISKKLMFS